MSCDSRVTGPGQLIRAVCLWLDMQLPQCFPLGSPAWSRLDTALQAERALRGDLWFAPKLLKVVRPLVLPPEQGAARSCKAAASGAPFGTQPFVPLCGFKVKPLIQCDPFKKPKHYTLQEGNGALSGMNHVLRRSRGGGCVAPTSSVFSAVRLS